MSRLYFTDFSMHQDTYQVASMDGAINKRIVSGGEIEFRGVMPLTPGSQSIVLALVNQGGIDVLQERKEFRCLYCGVVNPTDYRFCTQCGGPRGWLL